MAAEAPAMALWFELMQVYIREAWLLDERKFKDWLDHFTDDILYFMPRRKNVLRRELHREVTPLGDLAILEEDKRYLEMRVARLDSGMAWAEDPPSRTRHLIGNLEAAPQDNGEVQARTAFLVYRSHLETDHQLLSGSREDVLRQVAGGWKVAKRTILLDANVLLDKNLSVFLSGRSRQRAMPLFGRSPMPTTGLVGVERCVPGFMAGISCCVNAAIERARLLK